MRIPSIIYLYRYSLQIINFFIFRLNLLQSGGISSVQPTHTIIIFNKQEFYNGGQTVFKGGMLAPP